MKFPEGSFFLFGMGNRSKLFRLNGLNTGYISWSCRILTGFRLFTASILRSFGWTTGTGAWMVRFDGKSGELYPYLKWTEAHFKRKEIPGGLIHRPYPLTWEAEAIQADYEGMRIISSRVCRRQNRGAPHMAPRRCFYIYSGNKATVRESGSRNPRIYTDAKGYI